MVDQGIHGQVIVITSVQNDLLNSVQGKIVGIIDHCGHYIGHLRIGAFQCGIGIRLRAVQTKDTFRHNTGKRYDKDDQHGQEQAHTNQYLIEGMAHGPCGRDDRTPGTTCGSACCDFCNCLTAFDTSLNCCRCSICCCLCTFRCGLRRSLFGNFLGSLCSLSGGLAKIVLTISKLLLSRFCHGIHLLHFMGNEKRP